MSYLDSNGVQSNAGQMGVLQKSLHIKVSRIKTILLTIARLHNFCINERIKTGGPIFEIEDKRHDAANLAITSTLHSRNLMPIDDPASWGNSSLLMDR